MCVEQENSEFSFIRERRSPAESRLGACRLVRLGAAVETQTVRPPLLGHECASKYANAGGTAEGLPFVPVFGMKGVFICLHPL